MERWKKNGEKKLRVYLGTIFKTIFLFSIMKNTTYLIIKNYFLFLKTKNMIFSKDIF